MAVAKARKSTKLAWFGKKKKKKETVGKKVGGETIDAIKRRKKQMDELMGFMG
jgi:hypothetical protein